MHRYDAETGTAEVWGIGHFTMRVAAPAERVRAVVIGDDSLGLRIGGGQDDYGFAVGWNRHRRLAAIDDNTSVRFEWPTNDLLNVRVGTAPPDVSAGSIEEGSP